MKENDVIVIGGGLAGLMAAGVAAKQGKQVLMLSLGAGTLSIGGGTIDVIAYDDSGTPVTSPEAGIAAAANGHPYQLMGLKAAQKALDFFKTVCEEEGYPYVGNTKTMQWIPTAVGTLKPTCLVPKTMDANAFKNSLEVYVVGFEGLKDYYPQLIAKNLNQIPGYSKKYEAITVKLNFTDGRDISTLDVARWLDTIEGQQECISLLKEKVKPGSVLIVPPVLGTRPDYKVFETMEKALDCCLLETAGMPPAITGLRLRTMMLNYLRKLGVKIIEKAAVFKSVVENNKCLAVITENMDRERRYYAKSFVLATGGFYGGGLVAEPGIAVEPIFNLHIDVPADHELWTNRDLFSNGKQPFALFGIKTDEKMRPLAANGNVALTNVYISGRNLYGYDFSFEKSGNGVAVVSGYQAAMSV